MKTAQRSDREILPLPVKRSIIILNRIFSKEQSGLITAGFIPMEMEDKWFLFFENDTLFCHRSWTGHCIYQIHFTWENGCLHASSAEINRDLGQYLNVDDEKEESLIYSLIENFLLRRY